ncbi:MAG TPA: hypothetical protein DCY86_13385 [Bdellovibrionales bacterium]|nr:hypothetical protein [Bdellovibrionales bacterium]
MAQSVKKILGNKFLIQDFADGELQVGDQIEMFDKNYKVWGKARIEKIKKNQAIATVHEGQVTNGLSVKKLNETESESTPAPKGPSNFSVYYAKADFDYKEPGLMSITGDLSGFGVVYQYREAAHVTLEYESLSGNNGYDGQTQDGVPLQTRTEDKITNLRFSVGVPVIQLSRFIAVPYIGIGSRKWDDKLLGEGGYRREIQYTYAPAGLHAEVQVATFLSFFASGEYDYFISGKVNSHLSDADPLLPDIENKQKKGKGQRYSAGATLSMYNLFCRLHYFVRKWKIKDSEQVKTQISLGPFGVVELTFVEPANETKTTGIILEFGLNY